MTQSSLSVVHIGATGAVGSHVADTLSRMTDVSKITLLGRRRLEGLTSDHVDQIMIDLFDPSSYKETLPGHDVAICTLGVGQPSAVSKDEFVSIDKTAVLAFASSCRSAGIRHFELLGSVGADRASRSLYLRTKGQLEDGLRELGFQRLSLFRPSMILTPTNRYGISQGIALAVWPHLTPILAGPLRKYRGIAVERLGKAMALNLRGGASGAEVLHWDAIDALARQDIGT